MKMKYFKKWNLKLMNHGISRMAQPQTFNLLRKLLRKHSYVLIEKSKY